MLPFPHVVYFFANKFSCLRARRLTFLGILASALNSLFFRHIPSLETFLPKRSLGRFVERNQSVKGRKRAKSLSQKYFKPIILVRIRVAVPGNHLRQHQPALYGCHLSLH